MVRGPEPIHPAHLDCNGNHRQRVAGIFHQGGYIRSRYGHGIVESAVETVRLVDDE